MINLSNVACKLCGFEAPVLAKHLAKKHDLDPMEYQEQHPGAPWMSDDARELLLKEKRKLPREREDIHISKLFPDVTAPEEATVSCFVHKDVRTPVLDPHYVFPIQEALELLTILDKPERNNAYIDGPTGSGKTQLVRNLAALVRAPLFEINGSISMTRSHIMGKERARAGQTYFQRGIIPTWLEYGGWLLINEYDTLDADLVNDMKPVFETPRRLPLPEENDTVIEGVPDCRIIVSANTKARGDTTGLYINTNVQSVADLDRFHAFLHLDYLSAEAEVALLKQQFPDTLEAAIVKFVKVANDVRAAFKVGKLTRTLSTRTLVNWAENYNLFAGAHQSARVSFINSYDEATAIAVREMINTEFGQEDQETLVNEELAKRANAKNKSDEGKEE